MMLKRISFSVPLCLVLLGGCSSPDLEEYFDLVARFGRAEVATTDSGSAEDGLELMATKDGDLLFLPAGSARRLRP